MYMIKGPRARAARRQSQPGGGALKCGGSLARWSRAVTRACPVLLLAPHSRALLPGSRGSPAPNSLGKRRRKRSAARGHSRASALQSHQPRLCPNLNCLFSNHKGECEVREPW